MDWNAFIIPITLIGTQLIKQTPIDKKYLPWIAVALGAVLGAVWAASTNAAAAMDYLEYIVQGIVYGASAGLFLAFSKGLSDGSFLLCLLLAFLCGFHVSFPLRARLFGLIHQSRKG